MKKTYQKPALETMRMEEESMMATSMTIYSDTLGATNALSNEESDFNVWE